LKFWKKWEINLVAVSQSTHTRHHTENIVVHGEDLDGVGGVNTLEVEGSVVNAGHVAGTRGLMFLGFEGEGVHVHTTGFGARVRGGHTFVMLVRLHKLEILGHTGGETLMTVELELGGVIGCNIGTHSWHSTVLLNPHQLLHGMVEVEFDLGGGGFITGELELFNKVFVGHLGETTTFVGVEVDVVNIEGGWRDVTGTGTENGRSITEFKVDLDFVVLEGNEGEGKTGVTAEPELKGNEDNAVGNIGVGGGVLNKRVGTVHHKFVTIPMTSGLGKFVPDVEPVGVMFVNTLTTDFNFDGLDEFVTGPSNPGRGGTEIGLEVDAVDEITVSGDGACHLLAEVGETVESLFDGFHREVSVSAVDNFEESYLRVARQVNVLGTVSYELHKSTSHYVLF
jgi:hypothetical protein